MRIDFNPVIQGRPPIDPGIKSQLDALGLKPTGSREGDLAAIQAAMTKSSETKGIENNGMMQAPQTPPEIAAFMRSIGVEPTNSKEGDLIAVTSKLDQLEAQATSSADIANVNSLKATWAQLTSASAESDKQSTSDAFVGQAQLAKLNKFFLNKKSLNN